jgi:transposase-like protein
MDEKAAQKRRRRDRSVVEAERLAAAYENSGLSRQEFCRRNDVTLSTLSRYVTRHRRHRMKAAEPQQGLVSVEVVPGRSAAGGELVIVLSSDRHIEVRRGFDAGTLEQLIRLLERF